MHVDLLPRNICDHASLPRIEKRETRAISLEQALRSLVELKGGIIESKPKSSRGYRSIILPPFALEALKEHRERQQLMRRERFCFQLCCMAQLGRFWKCREPALELG